MGSKTCMLNLETLARQKIESDRKASWPVFSFFHFSFFLALSFPPPSPSLSFYNLFGQSNRKYTFYCGI